MVGITTAIQTIKKYNLITDGLVMWLDGINNTRNGHNGNATTWEDLSGNNIDWTKGSSITFNTNRVSFAGTASAENRLTIATGVNTSLISPSTYLNGYTYQYIINSATNNSSVLVACFQLQSFGWYLGGLQYICSLNTNPTCVMDTTKLIGLQ